MSAPPDANGEPLLAAEHPVDADTKSQIVRELDELIAALDRRLPQVERVGEVAIAKAAALLRAEASKRIDEIRREVPGLQEDKPAPR